MLRSITAVVILGAIYIAAAEVELYSDKYDYINVAEILENDQLREQYYNCFMDLAPCLTDDAVYFKGNFPEAIVTKCQKCTEKQQQNFELLVEWYTAHQEEKWTALVAKFLEDAKKMKIAAAGARK